MKGSVGQTERMKGHLTESIIPWQQLTSLPLNLQGPDRPFHNLTAIKLGGQRY